MYISSSSRMLNSKSFSGSSFTSSSISTQPSISTSHCSSLTSSFSSSTPSIGFNVFLIFFFFVHKYYTIQSHSSVQSCSYYSQISRAWSRCRFWILVGIVESICFGCPLWLRISPYSLFIKEYLADLFSETSSCVLNTFIWDRQAQTIQIINKGFLPTQVVYQPADKHSGRYLSCTLVSWISCGIYPACLYRVEQHSVQLTKLTGLSFDHSHQWHVTWMLREFQVQSWIGRRGPGVIRWNDGILWTYVYVNFCLSREMS